MVGISMFFVAFLMLFFGFPVAFTFAGVSMFFGFLYTILDALANEQTILAGLQNGMDMFAFMSYRIWSIMHNTLLIAIPLFIFMGIILQKSGLAQQLLESMGALFGKIKGGIAISTILVGSLLAASTGIVGASVVAMGVISLPVMLKHNYDKQLSTGIVCASGTLGQIIPPSIILIILADVFQVPVGDLFKAAIWPGLSLVAGYILYIMYYFYIKKGIKTSIVTKHYSIKKEFLNTLKAIIPPLALIIIVLGSIFLGVATPTESAAVGVVGAILLAIFYKKISFKMLQNSSLDSVRITAMVFGILIGATSFSMVFTYSGGDLLVEQFLTGLPGEKWGFLLFSMILTLILGFFIDFIEISYIVVPILVPISQALGIDPIWYAVLIAMNLQTSFLTPPFGFSLFYLKGVAPPGIKTVDIYKGVIPFIAIQMIILLLLALYPQLFLIKP